MRSSTKSSARSSKSVKSSTKKASVKKTGTKKSIKKSKKQAEPETVNCPMCLGMGKRLVRKNGVVKMVTCKGCDGEGQVLAADIDEDEDDLDNSSFDMDSDDLIKIDKKRAHSDGVLVVTKDLNTNLETSSKKLTDEQRLAKETIEERAAFFGCPGKVSEIRKGPVITMYEFKPAKTTRIKRLINLQEDLALALSAEAVMVRRIPGREVMGIEISNEAGERQNVGFRQSLQNVTKAKKAGMELPLNLGTDPFGEPVIDDLAVMPHLLIAGSTGSGKSVSLNCIISSLIAVCSPDDLQFYMIDPKGVELTHYNGIPHMRQEMVTSSHRAMEMLEHLAREMRTRLSRLTYAGVRDITAYNKLAEKEPQKFTKMPRIVMVIDELGDLMMQDRRGFTARIAEISQIARATGIHMICATQRPSVDVLSGRIKVNFPGRMAFKVTSATDSKVILHRKGAEGLLGRGDMLYLSPTRSTLIRIHAPWVPLEDVVEIADKIRKIEADRLETLRLADEKRRAEERKARMTEFGKVLVGEAETPKVAGEQDIAIDIGWASRK